MNRNVPLKPGKPLQRGSGLSSSLSLTTRKPLQRGTQLKPVSDKRKAENRERRTMAGAVFGDRPPCMIRWGHGCCGFADDLHEVLSRGRGGSITEAANTLPGCRWCHMQLTTHPQEAEARGFLLPSGRPRKAVPRWPGGEAA